MGRCFDQPGPLHCSFWQAYCLVVQSVSEAEATTSLRVNVLRVALSLVAVCVYGALQGQSLAPGGVAAVAGVAAVVPDIGTDLVG